MSIKMRAASHDHPAIPRRRAIGRLARMLGAGVGLAIGGRTAGRYAFAEAPRPVPASTEGAPERPRRPEGDGPIWIGHI